MIHEAHDVLCIGGQGDVARRVANGGGCRIPVESRRGLLAFARAHALGGEIFRPQPAGGEFAAAFIGDALARENRREPGGFRNARQPVAVAAELPALNRAADIEAVVAKIQCVDDFAFVRQTARE